MMQVHSGHKIQLKYMLYIKFDCLNVDDLLSVCFHMDKQNQNGSSMLWSRQMLNDHHQIDPHIYENQECLPISVMQQKKHSEMVVEFRCDRRHFPPIALTHAFI